MLMIFSVKNSKFVYSNDGKTSFANLRNEKCYVHFEKHALGSKQDIFNDIIILQTLEMREKFPACPSFNKKSPGQECSNSFFGVDFLY